MSLPHPSSLGPAGKVAMGLLPLGEAPRLFQDEQYDEQIALKADLLSQHGSEVFDCLPQAQQAFDEAVSVLGIATDFRTICLTVQEDLLVLVPRDDAFVLAGGGLFFPSLWRLQDKIGKPLLDVHAPVPHYAEQIGEKVNRLLTRLPATAPVMRYNWTLHDTPALYHPRKDRQGGEELYLRSERQTLSKLPESGAVLFTIKTDLAPLEEALKVQPDWARYLIEAISNMDEEMLAYKSLIHRKSKLLAQLKQVAN